MASQELKTRFLELCVGITQSLNQLGVTNFLFQIKSENLNYFVNSDPANDCNISKKKKKKSPSAKRRSLKRLEQFLFNKSHNTDSVIQDEAVITDPDPDPPEDTKGIRCLTCDQLFKNSIGLAIHESLKHRTITQLDGAQDDPSIVRLLPRLPTIDMKPALQVRQQDGEKKYFCKFCDKSSNERLKLAQHVRVVHCKGGNNFKMIKRFEQEHFCSEKKARESKYIQFWEKQ